MVFFNYATMQMAAKIVYYGPGLCGKTTNLHHIYAKTSPQSRGEMVSLETETDRTLFFDLLPIDVGVIGGFKTRLQLYTIPGQVFYNTTRKLVLKGVDGLVFVADSQIAALDSNVDSLANLRENLAEIGLNLDEIPLVLQLNKRDLPNIVTVDTLVEALDPEGKFEFVEAVASAGPGVFETLKLISKQTLRTLRRRMTGEEPLKTPPRKPLSETAQFRVKGESRPAADHPSAAAPSPGPAQPPPPAATIEEAVEEIPARPTVEEAPAPPIDLRTTEMRLGEPPAAVPQPAEPPRHVSGPETEIDFNEADKPAKVARIKTVKVRSTIDVMAELESLRKRATAGTPKAKKEAAHAAHPPAAPGVEVFKAVAITVPPGVLSQTRSVKVTLSFEDGDSGEVQRREESVQLDVNSDVQSVSLNVRIDQT